MTVLPQVREHPILFSAPMVRAILRELDPKTMTRRVVKWKVRPQSKGLNLNSSALSLGVYCTDVPSSGHVLRSRGGSFGCWEDHTFPMHCPYGVTGDRLYVKEATWIWCERRPNGQTKTGRPRWRYVPTREHRVVYCADGPKPTDPPVSYGNSVDQGTRFLWRYKTARFMPRWASRITLEINGVRVERVQNITETDAEAEGVERWVIGDGWREYGLSPADESACGAPMETARESFRTLWDSINSARGYGWDANPWVWAVEFKRLEVRA